MKKLYAVIGDPIKHSMSPAMHNDLFQHYGLNAHYHALHVKEHDLQTAVAGLKAIGISGFNVTVPHKIDILPLLDEVDPLAQAIGAVNTVVLKEGKLIGYNTDGEGSVNGILSHVKQIDRKRILIIGAGGAARAIYFSLAKMGATEIDITNRTVSSANHIIQSCPYPTKSTFRTNLEAETELARYDIIIQTTSVGMDPDVECQPLSLHNLRAESFVNDIIYNPLETKFLAQARTIGAKTQNGLSMFVLQGALAFEKWTGITPDHERMEQMVLKQLGGLSC